ncbi:alpha/beta-hydrolase [Sparassis crispa]|uniref:Carboxypeptidase n=1 Tax=Sparassis crispa TaxID=139825 RepID=A0A401H5G9_9APHY|nr:alpha/beta-hydrolase [Sparassis crispa]GBE89633.1 alpha/beta-hydrolase [Sparassis crispa]
MLETSWLALAVAAVLPLARCQNLTSSWPHDYPGIPDGDYSPEWQCYFEVAESLPNVTWQLPRSFAGNIGVQRAGHPNDTLFFWAFESEPGSLTATDSVQPWGIWLNGGPGASSLLGLLYENGPIHLNVDLGAYENPYAWNTLADYIWIDQPVGTGWATADAEGYAADEDQVASDFVGFLENLVKVFPSLATRPLYLTGESYAGTYIPYITKALFSTPNPPVKLAKIAIGDGTIGSGATSELLPTTYVIETYPQLIGYDPEVFQWFQEQQHLCGYDLNLTYPQDGYFPDLGYVYPVNGAINAETLNKRKPILTKRALLQEARVRYGNFGRIPAGRVGHLRRDQYKRDLTGRANGTIDPWYGCFTYDAMIDYALNFSYPWSLAGSENYNGFDVYSVRDALNPEVPMDGSTFFNDPGSVAALHAPTSKAWVGEAGYCFLGGEDCEDPSVEPMAFLNGLAANASDRGVAIVIYSGNDDTLVSHRGSQVVIQNTTFGGIQGFTREPSTPWYNEEGEFAGIVHQERNWTYILIKGAGHLVAGNQPEVALTVLREFILGNNSTGLVTEINGVATVISGEVSSLAEAVLPGQLGIYTGSGSTQGTYTYPSATIAAWSSYILTATASPSAAITSQPAERRALPGQNRSP